MERIDLSENIRTKQTINSTIDVVAVVVVEVVVVVM